MIKYQVKYQEFYSRRTDERWFRLSHEDVYRLDIHYDIGQDDSSKTRMSTQDVYLDEKDFSLAIKSAHEKEIELFREGIMESGVSRIPVSFVPYHHGYLLRIYYNGMLVKDSVTDDLYIISIERNYGKSGNSYSLFLYKAMSINDDDVNVLTVNQILKYIAPASDKEASENYAYFDQTGDFSYIMLDKPRLVMGTVVPRLSTSRSSVVH